MDFEAGALIYCMLAAIVAYAVNGWFVGWQPLFQDPSHQYAAGLAHYGWYVALGGASGILASFAGGVLSLSRFVCCLAFTAWTKPAVGGLLLGVLALRLPQVLGGGYGWIQEAIDGRLALGLLLVLVAAKMLALSFTVASGGSGGFSPLVCSLARCLAASSPLRPRTSGGPGDCWYGGSFSGAARVPIATLLMVLEMTGDYQILVPAGLAVMLSFVLQVNLSSHFKYGSLYEAQVDGRSDSPAHIAEHVQIALRLLEQGKITLPPPITHLHLAALCDRGWRSIFRMVLSLRLGTSAESPWVGKQLQSRTLSGSLAGSKVAAIMRGKTVMRARPDTVLQPGDRLLMIAPQQAEEALLRRLAPPSVSAAQAVALAAS